MHDARIFSNSSLNQQFRDGAIPSFKKVIVQDEPPLPVCLPILQNQGEAFFGFHLSSAGMVIECAFGRLKARSGCLRREMDINLK